MVFPGTSGKNQENVLNNQTVPDGFARYFKKASLKYTQTNDILNNLRQIQSLPAKDLLKNLTVLQHYELEPEVTSRRDLVFMADKQGHLNNICLPRR